MRGTRKFLAWESRELRKILQVSLANIARDAVSIGFLPRKLRDKLAWYFLDFLKGSAQK